MTRKSLITSNNKLKKNSKKEIENKPSNHIGSTMFDALKSGFGFGIGSSIAHSVIDKVTKTENNVNTFQQCIDDANKLVFNSEYESESIKAYKKCLCDRFQEGVCKSYLIKLN